MHGAEAMNEALTDNEKAFLKLAVRIGKENMPELREAWRAERCRGYDSTDDRTITRRVNALLGRRDVEMQMRAEEQRRQMRLEGKLKEADEAGARAVLTAAQARQWTLEALMEGVWEELDAMKGGDHGGAALAKLGDTLHKMTQTGGAEAPMSAAEAKAAMAALVKQGRRAEASVRAPAPAKAPEAPVRAVIVAAEGGVA